MKLISQASLLLLAFAYLPFSYASDSTEAVVNSISMANNFSTSDGNHTRIYQGGTTGQVGLPSGYSGYYVNGMFFKKGIGMTLSGTQNAQMIPYSECAWNSQKGNKFCYMRTGYATLPACTWTVNDNGAFGCATSVTTVNQYCLSAAECINRPNVTHSQNYLIRSVIGIK